MSDVVSVALITATVTLVASLGAVIITNIFANKRLHARMQHEKEEAIRERRTGVWATYLEPLRDSLYEFDILLLEATFQIDIVSQSKGSAKRTNELEKALKIYSNVGETIRELALAAGKVTDSLLSNTLKEFGVLCLQLNSDMVAKLKECIKSKSLTALKDISRDNKDTKNKISQRIMKCNKRIEELLSGCDAV